MSDINFSDSFLNILDKCEEKEYIDNNKKSLSIKFKKHEFLKMLMNALSTKKNFTAIKIINTLNLEILDFNQFYIINHYSLHSLYWLYKIRKIDETMFLNLIKKFESLKNYEEHMENIENRFINYQINYRKNSDAEKFQNYLTDKFENCNFINLKFNFFKTKKTIFYIFIDKIFNLDNYKNELNEIKKIYFTLDLNNLSDPYNTVNISDPTNNSLNMFDSLILNESTNHNIINKMRSNIKYKLNDVKRNKLHVNDDSILKSCNKYKNLFNKLKRYNIEFYLCSIKPLDELYSIIYYFFFFLDFNNTKSFKNIIEKKLNYNEDENIRRLFFSNEQVENFRCCSLKYLEFTIDSAIKINTDINIDK